MKKNVIITGGAGFIGSNLVEFILKNWQIKFMLSIITPLVQKKTI